MAAGDQDELIRGGTIFLTPAGARDEAKFAYFVANSFGHG
jgi:hypothetical protein